MPDLSLRLRLFHSSGGIFLGAKLLGVYRADIPIQEGVSCLEGPVNILKIDILTHIPMITTQSCTEGIKCRVGKHEALYMMEFVFRNLLHLIFPDTTLFDSTWRKILATRLRGFSIYPEIIVRWVGPFDLPMTVAEKRSTWNGLRPLGSLLMNGTKPLRSPDGSRIYWGLKSLCWVFFVYFLFSCLPWCSQADIPTVLIVRDEVCRNIGSRVEVNAVSVRNIRMGYRNQERNQVRSGSSKGTEQKIQK